MKMTTDVMTMAVITRMTLKSTTTTTKTTKTTIKTTACEEGCHEHRLAPEVTCTKCCHPFLCASHSLIVTAVVIVVMVTACVVTMTPRIAVTITDSILSR